MVTIPPSSDAPRWPEAICDCMARLAGHASGPERETARRDLWILLHGALTRSLDRQSGRIGRPSREDLDDLAATKALDLLLKAESGKWEVSDRSGPEIAGYLTAVARNALVDWQRRRQREVPLTALPGATDESTLELTANMEYSEDAPQWDSLTAREYADDLARCAAKLAPRSRWAWFLRVFYDLPTLIIARHPAVQLKPAHVDVILQRCRTAIRVCMEQRGQTTTALPPGTFVELWTHLRSIRPEMFQGEEEEGLCDPT